MKIVIPEHELKEVVADYLRQQMPERANENFDVKFTATRGEDGHTAEIEVSKRPAEVPTPIEEENTEEDGSEAAVDPFNFGGEDDS